MEKERALSEASHLGYGLDEDDHEEIANNYIRAVAKKNGFKYVSRPNIENFMDDEHFDKINRFERVCDRLGIDPEIAEGLDQDMMQGAMEMTESDWEDDYF